MHYKQHVCLVKKKILNIYRSSESVWVITAWLFCFIVKIPFILLNFKRLTMSDLMLHFTALRY